MDVTDLRDALDALREAIQEHADEAGFSRGPSMADTIISLLEEELGSDPEVLRKLNQSKARNIHSYAAIVLANALDMCLQQHALHVAETLDDPEDVLKDCVLTTQVIGILPVRGLQHIAQFVAERNGLIPTGSKIQVRPPMLEVHPESPAPTVSGPSTVH